MASRLDGIRVVIAEDHPDTLEIIEQIFLSLGAIVRGVTRARDALALVAEADIILTDFMMPGEDGVWLLEQVNRQQRPVPVIILSAFAEQHVPRLAAATPARKLLKPIDTWQLAEIVRDVLRGPSQ
jgi:CheY-like chemotaxis protein